jgi:EpsI family protein
MTFNFRFTLAATLLAGTVWLLHVRNNLEVVPQREAFASFPYHLGNWAGRDVGVPPDVIKTLGPGDFLLRDYSGDSIGDPAVDLFIAYFPSQRAGDTIHSPKNCLPGSGWLPLEASKVRISLPGQQPFWVNSYVVGRGIERALVLYWYWAHDRAVASEYRAKFYLLYDSIRLNRSDGSLIRVSTSLRRYESASSAQKRLLSLLENVSPILDSYVPR